MNLLLIVLPAFAGGTAWLDAPTYPVDQKTTLTLHYVVGAEGMTVGDEVTVDDPVFHGVRWSQWGILVLDPDLCTAKRDDEDPSSGLLTASTTGAATISLARTVGPDGGTATEHATTVIAVEDGALVAGDEIVIVLGDTSSNLDCGHELPERVLHDVSLFMEEDLGGSGLVPLSESPKFDIAADPTLATLYVEAPSRVLAGDTLEVKVVPMDRLGNAIEGWTGTVTLAEDYGGLSHTFSAADEGHFEFSIEITDTGVVHRIDVSADDGNKGRSNPIKVYAPADAPEEYVYWGDLHVHGGHDYEHDGQTIDENVRYARDIVGLDVGTEAMKADPVCLDGEALWAHLQDVCTSETVSGEYVYLFGFEWMGNLLGSNNGHHNFYVDSCTLDRPSHYDPVEFPDGIDGFTSGRGPYEYASGVDADGTQVVIIPHAPRYTGYNWSEDARNDDYRRSAEVYSEWGFDMEPPDKPGSIPDGLRNGNHMGFIAASDNHVGWMGNPFSYKNEPSGLAAFLAPSLDRASIFESLRSRHTYATTGARILLDTHVADGVDVPTGVRYVAAAPEVVWDVSGVEKIAEIKVEMIAIDGSASVIDVCVETPGKLDATGTCTIPWDGKTETAVWVQVKQEDDEQAWSSPTWLSADCSDPDVEDVANRCTGDTGEDSGETGTIDTADAGDSDTGKPPGGRCGCASVGGVSWVGVMALGLLRRRGGRCSRTPLPAPSAPPSPLAGRGV